MRYNVIYSLVKHQIIAAKPLEQFISSAKKNKNKVLSTIIRIVGLLFIASSFVFLLGSNYFGYMQISSFLNIMDQGISFCVFTGILFLLFVSTTYLEHVYFRGKDINLWHLLPISKSEFFLARFLVSYMYSLMITLVIVLPLIAAVFYYVGFSFLILIASIVLLLLFPVVPILLSSVLVTLKVLIFRGRSYKLVDYLFNNAPFILAVLYISKTSNEMLQLAITNDINNQLLAYSNYIGSIGGLPYFSLMGKMFFSSKSLLLFILVSALIFIISCLIIAPMFEKCLNLVRDAKDKESSKKRKAKNINSNELNGSNLLVSLIKREYYILSGEKGFLSETIGEALIPIILIAVWKFTGSLGAINEMMSDFSTSPYFIAIVFSIVQLFAVMVLVSSTSVSREGKLFRINKLLPIDIKQVVKAKVCFHIIFISLIQCLFIVAFVIFFKIELIQLVWMIPLFLINSVNVSLVGLWIDYSNPKLEWDVAISAMKRNMNGMLGMLGGLIVIAPSILILFFKFNLLYFGTVFSLIILVVLKKLVEKTAYKLVIQD